MKTQFENYIQSEINWQKLGLDDGPRINNKDFKIIEAFGSVSDIEFLTHDAIGLSIYTGSTGCTQSMQDMDGNVTASVTVSRI